MNLNYIFILLSLLAISLIILWVSIHFSLSSIFNQIKGLIRYKRQNLMTKESHLNLEKIYQRYNNKVFNTIVLITIINLFYFSILKIYGINIFFIIIILPAIVLSMFPNSFNRNILLINFGTILFLNMLNNLHHRYINYLSLNNYKITDFLIIFKDAPKFIIMVFILLGLFFTTIFILVNYGILKITPEIRQFSINGIYLYLFQKFKTFERWVYQIVEINMYLFGEIRYLDNNTVVIISGRINPKLIFWLPSFLIISSIILDIIFKSGYFYFSSVMIPLYFLYYLFLTINFSIIIFLHNLLLTEGINGEGSDEKRSIPFLEKVSRWGTPPQDEKITEPRKVSFIWGEGFRYQGRKVTSREISPQAIRNYRFVGYASVFCFGVGVACTAIVRSDTAMQQTIMNNINYNYTVLQRETGYSIMELKNPENPYHEQYNEVNRQETKFREVNQQAMPKRVFSHTKEVYSGRYYK